MKDEKERYEAIVARVAAKMQNAGVARALEAGRSDGSTHAEAGAGVAQLRAQQGHVALEHAAARAAGPRASRARTGLRSARATDCRTRCSPGSSGS